MNQENKFIYRITYTKGDRVKYISHLDFIRCFNRAFKRANIPVKYSNGFNPHILLNIALPCPVGVSSVCEMLDIELTEKISCDDFASSMTKALPCDIKILKIEIKESMSDFFAISSALYYISFKSDKAIRLEDFSNLECLMIEKKSKRGMKEVNIMDFVRSISLEKSKDLVYDIKACIDAGSESNLKPELLLKAMQSYFNASFSNVYTRREKIYFAD